MNWEPIQPIKDKVKAVEIDPQAPGLVIIEVPLNRRPEPEWKRFIERPEDYLGEYTVSVHSPEVEGERIILRADRRNPNPELKWAYKYIELANERYKRFLGEKKESEIQEAKKQAEVREELEKITERIRK